MNVRVGMIILPGLTLYSPRLAGVFSWKVLSWVVLFAAQLLVQLVQPVFANSSIQFIHLAGLASIAVTDDSQQHLETTRLLNQGLMAYQKKDYETAWKLLSPLAEAGNAEAQRKIGAMYRHGRGVEKNDQQAIKWYRQAASQGHVRAQNNLGIMYRFGLGVEKNPAEAEKWLTAAAEQGDGKGQENLGILYMEGDGVARDDSRAVYWLNKAAQQGHIRAQFSLGLMKLAGRGTAKDEVTGMAWVRRAAESGHPQAAGALAKAYSEGLYGLKKDLGQARFWYGRAGKQVQ